MGCLYKIDFPNGKAYIGISTVSVERRFVAHCATGNNSLIGRAIRKHGKTNVTLQVLVMADDWKYLCELEKKAIVTFGTKNPAGYNVTDGGEGTCGYVMPAHLIAKVADALRGRTRSIEIREKISAGKRASGFKFSKETRLRMALSHIGKVDSAETRAKKSAALKGHMCSEATKAKLRIVNKGQRNSAESIQRQKEARAATVLVNGVKCGWKRTQESIEKQRATLANKKQSQERMAA